MSIQEIRRRAEELAGRTQTASIEPHDVGGLIGDLADYVNKVEANGSSLGIRKTYVTISAMEADTNPQDESGNPLKKGMLVSIYNQDDPSSPDNGKVFSWQNPGWQLCYKLDAGYATREELVVLEKRVEALETGYEGGGIPDAPRDDNIYARHQGKWVVINQWHDEMEDKKHL